METGRAAAVLRKELKERFLGEFTPYEQAYFLRTAREAILQKRYRASEDLFHYCYCLTLKERFRGISAGREDGVLRYLLVEGSRDLDDAVRLYEERLEKDRLPVPDQDGKRFLESLSG
jgi:hypothetical protein